MDPEMAQRMQEMRQQRMQMMQQAAEGAPQMGPRGGMMDPEMMQRMQEMHQQRMEMMQQSAQTMPQTGPRGGMMGPRMMQRMQESQAMAGAAPTSDAADDAAGESGSAPAKMGCKQRHAGMGKYMQGMRKERMAQKQAHRQAMEARMANIEALLRELVELQKAK
jgi:hypothetical protein